jgi:O-antigen/teichoic acid export membrane protein
VQKLTIKNLRALISQNWKNPKARQVLMLFSVNIAGIPMSIITSIIFTHYLGPNAFGDYQFMDNLFNFTVLITTFGFFQAANRALVLNHDKEKARQYYGATFIILLGMFVIMSVGLFFYSLYDPNLKEKHLSNLLFYSIPIGWAYLSINYFEVLFQADNKISLLAIQRIFPKIGFLISAIIIYAFLTHIKTNRLQIAWSFYVGTLALVCIYVLIRIRLSFKNLKATINEIWNYNKTYGFHVYIGAAFSTGVASLTPVIISYFGFNNSGVGFYALATALANPLTFIPNTIATTNYKEFASHQRIPKKLTMITIGLTLFSLVALWVLVPPFIKFFYGKKFQSVVFINFVVSIGVAFYGIADYFNRFLGAHGLGKLLRNTSFITGSFILVFNFVLIPRMGVNGAALTRLLGGLTYLSCILYYYRKTINKMPPGSVENVNIE